MPQVFVAAGSNIDPTPRLQQALAAINKRFGEIGVSRAYKNEAVGFAGDDFINLVVSFATDESPGDVLQALHEIEESCGRMRDAPKWAPRAMDLDILMYGDLVAALPGLTLPRPDLIKRAYMLGPMAELAPHVPHPVLHKTMAELWAEFDQRAHVLEPIDL